MLIKLNILILCYFIFLSIITIGFVLSVPAFKRTGSALPVGEWIVSQQTKRKKVKSDENFLSLSLSNNTESLYAWWFVKTFKPNTWLMLEAEIKCNNVIAGRENWEKARLILAQIDKQGKRLKLPHTLVALDGSCNWKNYSKAFYISSKTQKLKLASELLKGTETQRKTLISHSLFALIRMPFSKMKFIFME